jgi:thiamine-phosphate pyrophosphorylase
MHHKAPGLLDDAREDRFARLPRGLYVLTPETDDDEWLFVAVAAAIRGGASAVQYRNKALAPKERLRQAARVHDACRGGGALFLVNDSIELAAELQADGVHLGRDDAKPLDARDRLGSRAIIGVSCYDSLEFALRTREVADYCAFGSVFPSKVKPAAVRAPLGLFREAREAGLHPVAIGGIDADNARQVAAAGAAAIAVITATFGEASEKRDPAAIEDHARRILKAFVAGRSG